MGRRSRNDEPPSLVDEVRSHASTVAAFFEPALPYATQAAASAVAFTAGLVATQVIDFFFHVVGSDIDVDVSFFFLVDIGFSAPVFGLV